MGLLTWAPKAANEEADWCCGGEGIQKHSNRPVAVDDNDNMIRRFPYIGTIPDKLVSQSSTLAVCYTTYLGTCFTGFVQPAWPQQDSF